MARDEMSEKMVELSTQPDAEWKKIQQNTFTRWVNQQLKTVNVAISDLETGFEDGLKLIRLVEVLSGRHLGKFSKKVSFRSQKLENISLVLNFLENDEHVKIVNIDSSAIVDRNLKLILGLVWTLIVHYSISKQVWILPECEKNVVEEVSPREKLMVWIRGKLPGELALSNFMSDWNSGVLLAALVSSCAPDLGIDWRNWDIASPLCGTRMVMKLAEKHLGVAQLVTAEELLSTAVDERSVMTYLAQFPQAQYKPPLGRIEGVDPNPLVGRVSQFKVYTLRESVVVDVLLRGPDRKPLDAAIIKLTPLQYSVSYSPPTVGLYEICVSVRDPEVGDFAELELETALANLEQRFSYERVTYIGRAVVFQLDNAEEGCVEMLVEDSDGNTNLLVLTQQNTSSCYAEFTPQSDGPHLVHVSCYNKPIQGSPFELDVRHQAELVRVWGSGIAERGVHVGEVVTIFMKTDDQCTLPFLVRITGPDGEVSVTESIDEEANVRTYTYVPRTVGDYEIEMKCGDVDIQRTRTVVHVEESCLSDIRAFGCGLLGGVQGMRCVFFLQYGLTDADKLKYAVKDQRGNELKVDGVQFENGSAVLHSLHFTPDHPGVYELSVLLSGKHVMDSPFYLLVDSGDGSLSPSNACVHGLDYNQYVSVGEEASFEVDVTAVGGNIVPSVQILDDDFIDVPFHVKERRQNVFEFTFTPQSAGRHFVVISVAGMALSDSPFVVSVESEAMRAVRVDGWDAGVRSVIRAEQPIDWAITAEWIGKNTVEAVLVDPRGIANPLPAQKTANNELLIRSVAPQPGIYALKLIVNGKEAASREVVVEPQVDVSQIKVGFLEGENVDMVLNQQCSIRVDTAGMLALERGLEVVVEDPDGERNILELASLNGVYTGDWKASKVGETKIMVLFDGVIVKEMRAVIRDSESGSDYQDEAGRPWSDSGDCKENTAVDIKAALERSREMDEAESEKVVSPAPFEETRHFYFDVEETFQFNNMAAVVKTPSGENRAAIIQELGKGRAEVVYKPTEAGHHVLIIKHDNTDVEGSPIEFDVVGEEERSNAVAVKGAGLLRAIAGLPTGFVICTAGPLDDELSVLVDGAAKAKVDISKDQTGAYAVKLIPPIAGEYKVHLKVGSKDLDGSPLFVVAEDDRHKRSGDSAVSFVEVSLEVGAVRELCVMTATVKGPSSTEEPCMVRPVDATHIGVNFTPNEVGDYVIVVSKNGSVVHDLPSLVHVDDKGFASLVLKGRGDQQEVVGKSVELDEVRPEEMITRTVAASLMETCCFKVIAHETFDLEKLSAFVKTPSGDRRPAHIQRADGVGLVISYKPTELGLHVLSVTKSDVEMEGSLIEFYVDEGRSCAVMVEGLDLEQAIAGVPVEFTISAVQHLKDLSVSVDGAAKANVDMCENEDGRCTVKWTPPIAGKYNVNVKVGNENVQGSPFTTLVKGEPSKRSHVLIARPVEVSLETAICGAGNHLVATVKNPAGVEEPCSVHVIDPTHVGVWLIPREVGDYEITVVENGSVMPGSPFLVSMSAKDVGDASKVIVSKIDKSDALCLRDNGFVVDTRKAGGGEVFVSIEGRYRADINYEEDMDGVTSFSYRPSHPGFYVIVVMFNGKHVEGSPFTVKCGGEGHEAIERAMLTESTKQVPTVMADEKVSLAMCLPWVNAEAMRATVMAPDRSLLDARLQLMGNSLCLVKFKPVVEGVHVVSLFRNRRHITGSPFEFTVGSLEESGAHKVRIGGIGLEVGETNEIRSFNIYAREAGEGKLQVSVEGPSKAQMDIYERENGIYHFQYSVSAPGWYVISVSFNDEDVPDSPFKVFICGASEAGSTDKALAVEGPLRVGEECALSLTLDTKPALLETKLLSPNGAIHKVDVVNSEAAVGRYELRFIPQEIGIYLLELFVDGSPLRTSPLPLHIEAAEVVDASLVTVHGDGVRLAHTGRQSQFTVDSRHAGSGELYLEFVGPSKVAADAHQVLDGQCLVCYTPFAPGVYYVTVKFSGVHVPGSPFKLTVMGDLLRGGAEKEVSTFKVNMASHLEGACAMEKVIKLKGDASKVTCSGEGLAKFLPGQQASFTVDTSSAGVDVLTVGAVTASGPCEYIKTTHVGEGRYAVAYRIGEPTVGFIFVEYGGVDIPGSPFRINC